MRKNHTEGRHVCPAEGCGRRFITPYYMNFHAKTHYGIRDEECQWCGQRFFNKKHLNQHVEVAHKKSRFYCQVPGCTSGEKLIKIKILLINLLFKLFSVQSKVQHS